MTENNKPRPEPLGSAESTSCYTVRCLGPDGKPKENENDTNNPRT